MIKFASFGMYFAYKELFLVFQELLCLILFSEMFGFCCESMLVKLLDYVLASVSSIVYGCVRICQFGCNEDLFYFYNVSWIDCVGLDCD